MIVYDVIIWTDIPLDEECVQIAGGTSDEDFRDRHPSPEQTWLVVTDLFVE